MLRREIGGDFHEIEDLHKEIVNDNVIEYLRDFYAIYFDSGRSSLRSLLKNIEYKNVLFPAYICESVRECFDVDCNAIYYEVDSDLKINWSSLIEKINSNTDIVYLHFFNGYIGAEYDFSILLELKKKYNFTIIEDTTHSFFSMPHTVGDYCICSLRKWFPISDGGVLYSQNSLHVEQCLENNWANKRRAAMSQKKDYLTGKINDKKEFLTLFASTENELDEQNGSCCISNTSYDTLKKLSCTNVINRRRSNYEFLSKQINCKQTAYGGINQVPLFFTISLKNRDLLRSYFIENNIFCPVHWPLYNELNKIEGAVENNKCELSIPIDQRYDIDDMVYIHNVYSEYMKRGDSI